MRAMTKALVGVMTLALSQTSPPGVAELLSAPGELSPADVEAVVTLTSDLIVGKTFMSYGGFGGGTLTVGPGPRAGAMYYGDRATEWPGVPARSCDGTPQAGELVLEWELIGTTWQVTPYASPDPRVMDGMFDLWGIEPGLVQDAGSRDVEGVTLRGLRYPYAPPQGARFKAEWQTLWLDSRTGMPLRYEIAIESPDAMDYGYYFAWAPGWDRRPDSAIERPDCIPVYPRR